MYEDAIKTSGHADDIELREISELVLEALDLEPAGAVAGGDDDADPASSNALAQDPRRLRRTKNSLKGVRTIVQAVTRPCRNDATSPSDHEHVAALDLDVDLAVEHVNRLVHRHLVGERLGRLGSVHRHTPGGGTSPCRRPPSGASEPRQGSARRRDRTAARLGLDVREVRALHGPEAYPAESPLSAACTTSRSELEVLRCRLPRRSAGCSRRAEGAWGAKALTGPGSIRRSVASSSAARKSTV